jgi:peptidyl-dipeptidase A
MKKIIIFLITLIQINLFGANYMKINEFDKELKDFLKEIEKKEEMSTKAFWLLETTGSNDAAFLAASLDSEMKILFSNKDLYQKFLSLKEKDLDPLLRRQVEILIDSFKGNMLPKELLQKISKKESELAQLYASFRAKVDGKEMSENDLRDILSNEINVEKRKKAYFASKEIGDILAPHIIEVVKLRNEAAKILGYKNYFEMSLDLQEISKEKLLKTFDEISKRTENVYNDMIEDIYDKLSKKYKVSKEEIGPWAFKDPFSQMDPLEEDSLKAVFENKDVLEISKKYYEKMGFNIDDLIKNSDLYERENKNQHAFCIAINRKGDVRTLNNIKPNIKWQETLLHEFGHALYYLYIDKNLPWLLINVPHTLNTEAIAMFMGRQAYDPEFLKEFLNVNNKELLEDMKRGFKRRQLIFSRSALLITEFEKNMYANPDQNLNILWWDLVEKHQKIKRPENRENKNDWASKYHVGLAPVYYYAYMYGEVYASSLSKRLKEVTNSDVVWNKKAAKYLIDKVFDVGAKYRWDKAIEFSQDEKFSIDAWVEDVNR